MPFALTNRRARQACFLLLCGLWLPQWAYGMPCSRAVRAASRLSQVEARRSYSPSLLSFFQAKQWPEAIEVEIGRHAVERFDAFVREHGVTYDLYARSYADFLIGQRDYREFYHDPLGIAPRPGFEPEPIDAESDDLFEGTSGPFIDPNFSSEVDLESPPSPTAFAIADLSGMDEFVRNYIQEGGAFHEFYESAMENGQGMQGKANSFYEVLIQYYVDKKLRKLQSPESLKRAKLLSQRIQPLNEVLLFYAPSEEQQEVWGKKLQEPRWKNVPRVVWLYPGSQSWLRSVSFRNQIDLVRTDLSRPGAQPVACQVRNLFVVGSDWDPEDLGQSLRTWRASLVKRDNLLKVTLLDFEFGRSQPEVADEILSAWTSYPELADTEPPGLIVRFEQW